MSYDSPTEGLVQFGSTGPLTVKGRDVPLSSGKRYDNPWALADVGASQITIADKAGDLRLDFATSTRTASSRRVKEDKHDDTHDDKHDDEHGRGDR